ncbi:MAG: hypothetical protein EA371_14040 [Gammaproteobacteria bacterium]|nr:MAG: hypothetical protein EA371_14040 [Gammaproteobacteria bacterium]
MSPGNDCGTPDALQAYLDDLLGSGLATACGVTDGSAGEDVQAAQARDRRESGYRLLRAGSVKVALPEAAVAVSVRVSTAIAEVGHSEQARCWLDLASMLHGRPVAVASPTVGVPLAGAPGWGLSVDAEEEIVQVTADTVTWREPRGARRWLAGLIEVHGAVVIDPAALIEEAEVHGIQGAV